MGEYRCRQISVMKKECIKMDDKRHIYGGHGCQTLRLKLVWDRRSAHIVKVYSHAGQSYIFFSEKQTNKQTPTQKQNKTNKKQQ